MTKHDVIVNIRQASISNEVGLIALELEGLAEELQRARQWLSDQGLTVEPVEMDVIE